jgi:hypothetical protein
MKLWSYNPVTGIWCYERAGGESHEARQWLEYWRRTDPTTAFRLAKHKPRGKPRDGERGCEIDFDAPHDESR